MHALFCALAVLVCDLVSRPFTTMGICDDGPYILIARKFAATGHIYYNGPTTPILGWQLYLADALIKLFGFSFTVVRMSTLLVAMTLAFVLQRAMVRANINERNATIGTLALVLSPLYLALSSTFMTDIHGLFALVICLYGCLRAIQAATSRAAIAWLCFAVATNAICGTSRQIAWLGVLVMVPSALWLLRKQRRVLLAGTAAILTGILFILGCILWFQRQPYNVHEHLLVSSYPVAHILAGFIHTLLDVPFLLLPIVALFFPELRASNRRAMAILSVISLIYLVLAIHWRDSSAPYLLEPTLEGQWVDLHGIFNGNALKGVPPIFLNRVVQVLLTIASLGGLFGVIASLARPHRAIPAPALHDISWKQLGVLLAPYAIVYSFLLIPRAATTEIFDRYLLGILFVPLLCLVRYYQDHIQPRLPHVSVVLVALTAIYGITVTHNTFALYRARVILAAELRAAGVPDTSVDSGWEYNMGVELQYSTFINDPRMVLPVHAYVPTPQPPPGICDMFWYDDTPHIHPVYGVSFDPNACYGPAPFSPVSYSRWLASKPGNLYVVKFAPPSKR